MSVSIVNTTTSKQAEKLAEIGAQFKRIREDKDLSIPALTATTLISERYLRAIEDGQIESLPEPIYVRGFIRKYGSALGVGDLSDDFPLNPVLPDKKWAGSAAAELRPLHLYALYIGVIAGAVSLLATFLNSPESKKINDSQTNFSNAAQVGSVKVGKATETADILLPKAGGLEILKQRSSDPSAMVTPLNISEAALQTPKSDPLSNNSTTNNSINSSTISSTTEAAFNDASLSISESFQSWVTNVNLQDSSAIAVSGDFEFVGNKPINVGILMKGQSWVRITVDGKIDFEGVLDEGKKLTWSGDRQISIRAGNASSVGLSYNNQPIKSLGKEGEVAERLFSASSPSIVKPNDLISR